VLAGDARSLEPPEALSPYIVVDQFGYRTTAEKIAVVRSPSRGFDAGAPFAPGTRYALVDVRSRRRVLEGAPAPWNGGAVDPSSGDKAWWFDFSGVTTPGEYFVLDEIRNVRSDVLRIDDGVYRGVLRQALRMFYYQRDGTEKDAVHAGADWTDDRAHPQDARCGFYTDGSAPRDLHGGWFDAGDQNRYTRWAASDVIELLRAYVESPASFADDEGIPESGNGLPDVLDELRWELDWLTRMQGPDGAVLSVVGHAGASPPSTDTSPCRYGPATTSATLASAAAFARASLVFRSVSAASALSPGFADDLARRAELAWTWAVANPEVTFTNAEHGIAAGEQEVDAAGRRLAKLQAAVLLFELTGAAGYRSLVDAGHAELLASFDPFHMEQLDAALEYARLPGATPAVAQRILETYRSTVKGSRYFGKHSPAADPYLAWLETYTWGSNQVKAAQGTMLTDLGVSGVDAPARAEADRYAERYVHYLHGVNPLGLVYLSNMGAEGAARSVTRFFHTWFAHGSMWDAAGVSRYGPPPGFLVGGPNPSYAWDSCCPSGCASFSSNARCGPASPSPPAGQPDQKSYKDFNDGWPIDSWSVSEPSDTYQARYVRLLSKFVR
jgi:hypothetical protein